MSEIVNTGIFLGGLESGEMICDCKNCKFCQFIKDCKYDEKDV